MLISLACIYVMLAAPFIAAVQILIYAGAIMVLVVFVIMLLNLDDDKPLNRLRYLYAVGVIFKRNALGMFMCIELMLNAVNLTFVAFSRYYADVTGQLFVFMVMSVAAAEAAVGLGIIIAFFRNRLSIDTDDASILKN